MLQLLVSKLSLRQCVNVSFLGLEGQVVLKIRLLRATRTIANATMRTVCLYSRNFMFCQGLQSPVVIKVDTLAQLCTHCYYYQISDFSLYNSIYCV